VILVAREPSIDELKLADSLDVTLITNEIALDAFVFILNVNNPVNNLTVDQVQNIYTGNLINWREVGGSESAINPYQRNKNSGSQELMETLVMKGLQMVDAPEMLVLAGMMGPINKLVQDPYGICYTVYFFNQFMAYREQIKLCKINGIEPNFENLLNGDYMFTTEVFAAIRADLDESNTAFTLWKWVQTLTGQRAIGESGYIPVRSE
jgi:phosphate transport system substrate-binding protein